ncbi:BON domain-containing protein [Chitinolyticbacter meiyuanensis]|uniref:BON domain-containing protein n=1 Tax=Chitinolyticbacter meiyuanensis TaxID=682798 RepID=UPI0011E5C02B|nr:BON domain-containing protein [Chitinolyticbacter meiyuanensis]
MKPSLALIATPLLLAGMLTACEKKDETAANDASMEASMPTTMAEASAAVHAGFDNAASATASAGHAIANATDNAALTAKVKTVLAADEGLKTLALNIDSENGVVTLSGEVDSEAQRSRAEQQTKSVEGVQTVNNQLTVKH